MTSARAVIAKAKPEFTCAEFDQLSKSIVMREDKRRAVRRVLVDGELQVSVSKKDPVVAVEISRLVRRYRKERAYFIATGVRMNMLGLTPE